MNCFRASSIFNNDASLLNSKIEIRSTSVLVWKKWLKFSKTMPLIVSINHLETTDTNKKVLLTISNLIAFLIFFDFFDLGPPAHHYCFLMLFINIYLFQTFWEHSEVLRVFDNLLMNNPNMIDDDFTSFLYEQSEMQIYNRKLIIHM